MFELFRPRITLGLETPDASAASLGILGFLSLGDFAANCALGDLAKVLF